MKVILNGRSFDLPFDQVAYEQLVTAAGNSGNPSITYRARLGGDIRREGTLCTGQTLVLSEGMVINVMHTGNA